MLGLEWRVSRQPSPFWCLHPQTFPCCVGSPEGMACTHIGPVQPLTGFPCFIVAAEDDLLPALAQTPLLGASVC